MKAGFFKSKVNIIALIEIVIGFIITFMFYDKLPQQVPIHWNSAFEADNFISKPLGAYFAPLMNMGMFILLLILPKIDPKAQNYKDFTKFYNIFRVFFHSLILIIQISIILVALKVNINIGLYMMILGCIAAIVFGNYLSTIRFNYFVGVKTPWTLASEHVWKKTHRIMGHICVTIGFVGLIGIFILSKPVWGHMMMSCIIGWALFGFIYSYVVFRNESKNLS